MPNNTCSVDGCEKSRRARGWCDTHYRRWRRNGEPGTIETAQPPAERFWSKVNKTEICWNYEIGAGSSGYAHFKLGGKSHKAHRLSYEWAVGPIPEGMQIDHMCHNRRCVRPDHLRPVTNKQNHENRAGAQSNSATGVRGVVQHKRTGKFYGVVAHHGKRYATGRFTTVAEAEAAVVAKRLELYTHNLLDRAPR